MRKFKVGDRVRVKNVEIGTSYPGYWFTADMSKYIGSIFTIVEDCDDGTYKFEGLAYFWAGDWLEPTENKENNMGDFEVGDKVRVKNVEVGAISGDWIFVTEMSKYIGKKFTIVADCGEGVYMLNDLGYSWTKDWLEPTENEKDIVEKFKLGDRVRVCNIKVNTNSHGHTFTSLMSKYIGKVFTIKHKYDDDSYRLDNIPFFWAEDWLESAKPEMIVIYRVGNETVALNKTTGEKAEAKCLKDDEYDFYIGAKIAFERLINKDIQKEEPKLYNGKIVCTTSAYKFLTKGKVYEFKNGCSQYDNGDCMPKTHSAVVSFEDLEKKMPGRFVELVEDSK